MLSEFLINFWSPFVSKNDSIFELGSSSGKNLEILEIDSFFNTRKNVGLPPEAICNPSLSSLQAVAEPEETEYWYYLTGKDGKMYYAVTLEEHNQNIVNYL